MSADGKIGTHKSHEGAGWRAFVTKLVVINSVFDILSSVKGAVSSEQLKARSSQTNQF